MSSIFDYAVYHWLAIANVIILSATACWCWFAIDTLCFWERMYERHLQHWCFEEAKQAAQAPAWRRLVQGLLVGGAVLAYVHVYSSHCDLLLARRTAARSQPPPWGCEGNTQRWDDLGFAEKASIQLSSAASIESACATYLEHVSMSTWANVFIFYPVVVNAADALGDALDRFLSHHSFLMQMLLVVLLVAVLVFVIVLRCTPTTTPPLWRDTDIEIPPSQPPQLLRKRLPPPPPPQQLTCTSELQLA